ncbi:MAG: Transcription elongation factor GreA [Candidatus Uhrbacteria bacterium GW2011_GWD2_41_121]|uniref:Transcription elongation factor GreA n=1 Tax=Candidatus Uhrbacteria bacterium GW2011_GWC1_41_20 TaxID=1618983 RepID=A0A0G0VFX0_9BACT|nr:MAG: Transcription elongation factor GreA [Candidatus Uhrbacteria bacterium GW2011_GWE1_39_46]KKR64529.1 MAG: Transcription elongation factor GreA [Candidatus Uhrbacteria bacterium GW2011_GWC2_40_450]KKR90601.1 MAG: Transcription elongation factor GreA [Candidatus Uhrbacteria bacterium GW2011_GWD2_41_121]KKR90817.1 MAG: Transcription elongation factor GreA [Candidatus Uhrbacteria bacterium GW2011_GWE2_41_1153]KKR96512.1 MAG: Transcription elongation factor GreA [Candidatus Uhrbacteria bacter
MSQHYLSQDALNALKIELQERKTVQRAELSEQIGSAKELGDLSENFEYHDAKERQGQNETRILEIEDMLRNIVLVESKSGGSKIMLGTTFKAKSGNIEKTFEIVGASESDPINGKISNESPLGNAFLGLAAGDIASITTPAGKIEYKVISID